MTPVKNKKGWGGGGGGDERDPFLECTFSCSAWRSEELVIQFEKGRVRWCIN